MLFRSRPKPVPAAEPAPAPAPAPEPRAPDRVVFLHIPKTGGHSVRQMLTDAYGAEAVCPARTPDELLTYTVPELNTYKVFALHCDWSTLDALDGTKYVFTVLRDPMDRILSYYFYVRQQASKLAEDDRNAKSKQGLRAAHELSVEQYFIQRPPQVAAHIEDMYNNFYTFYFATRRWDGRRQVQKFLQNGKLGMERLSDMATANLATLGGVFRVDQMEEVRTRIEALSGKPLNGDYRLNQTGGTPAAERRRALAELGANDAVFEMLERFCAHDNAVWARRGWPPASTAPRNPV